MKLLHTREPSPTIRMWRTAKSAGNGSTRRAARAFCVTSSSGCRMAPTFDCVTIEKASGTAAVDPDFAAINPGYLLEAARHRRRGAQVGRLLRLDVGGLNDRPPFVDFR